MCRCVHLQLISGNSTIIVVDVEDGRIVVKPPQLMEEAEIAFSSDTIATLPVVPRIVTSYTRIAECVLDSQHYYLPAQYTNPLFDAFFLQVTATKVLIWVLASGDRAGAQRR